MKNTMTQQALRAFEARLKDSSKTTIRYALVRAARDLRIYDSQLDFVNWNKVDALTLQELTAQWSGEMAAATLNLHLSALRGIFRSYLAHGLLSHQKYIQLTQIESPALRKSSGLGNYVEDECILKLMESCVSDERQTLAARDRAIVAVLFGTIIGRTQAVNVQIGDIDLVLGSLYIPIEGGQSINRMLHDWAIPPLQNWLDVLAGQGQFSGPLLRRISSGGRALQNMRADGLYKALKNRCVVAGIQVIKPRDARRTVATNLIYSEGGSLEKITLGSQSLTATLRF